MGYKDIIDETPKNKLNSYGVFGLILLILGIIAGAIVCALADIAIGISIIISSILSGALLSIIGTLKNEIKKLNERVDKLEKHN